MRTLSKIIIACAASLCIFSSCKKSNVSPKLSVESITFTINGTKHTLTNNVSERTVPFNVMSRSYVATILASSSQNKESMGLEILYTDSLKKGVYMVDNDISIGNITFTLDSDNGYSYVVQDFTNPNIDTITITEIGTDYIKGSFLAKLSAIVPSGSQPVPDITITNGEFYAKTAPAN